MIRASAVALVVALLGFMRGVAALGVGNIEVESGLNEPLLAQIELRAVQSGDIEQMTVSLGTAEQFARAGIERPFHLATLRFEVLDDGGEQTYIRVTTEDPVVEPFLNFLVEVNWARGRVIREYTVLLDPPVYGAAIADTVEQTVSTVEEVPELTAAAPEPEEPEPEAASTTTTVASAGAPGSYGPVVSTDTLWSIAERYRPDGSVSVQRMMLSILAANPEAFSISNVNALREGAVLRIPSRAEIGPDEKAEAMDLVRRQHAAWQDYRQALAASTPSAPDTASETTGDAMAEPEGEGEADEAEAAGDMAAEVEPQAELKVVAGEAGAGVGAGGVQALRDELNLALEQADATQRENEELSMRLSEAEAIITDLNRMVELKDEDIASLQDRLVAQQAAAAQAQAADAQAQSAATDTQAAADEAQTEDQEAKEKAPPPPPPEPTLLETIEGMLGFSPIVGAVGLVGMILIIGGLLALMRRRRAAAEVEDEAAAAPAVAAGGSMIDEYAETELPADTEPPAETEPPGDEDVTEVPAAEVATAVGDTGMDVAETPVSDDDPLAEVNVYLAYERYDQAEELIEGAIQTYPERHEYRLRLLEVLHAARNVGGFHAAAQGLREAAGADSPMLEQAAVLWAELSPGTDLLGPLPEAAGGGEDFGATVAESSTVDMDLAGGETTGVDFDLGFEITSADDEAAGGGGLDFDLGEATPEREPSADSALDFDLGAPEKAPGEAVGEATSGLDFDLGDVGDLAATEDSALADGTSLDFDLGDETAEAGADSALDFDLGDAPSEKSAAQAAEAPAEDDESILDFDLGDAPSEESAAQAAEAPAGDDESILDFDLGDSDKESVAQVTEAPAEDDASILDFDLGDTAGEAPAAAQAPAADEASVLDFDLGDGEAEESAPEAAAAPAEDEASVLDFDLGDAADDEPAPEHEPLPARSGALADGDDSLVDFDLGEAAEAREAPAESEDLGVDLDLGDAASVARESASSDEDDDIGLDLDLGDAAQSPTDGPEPAEGVDLSLDAESVAGDLEPPESAQASDDIGLDFDIGGEADAPESATVDDAAEDERGLDFSLDLSEQTSPDAAAAPVAEDDGGLDLDLSLDDAGDSPDSPAMSAAGDGVPELDLALDADDAPELEEGESIETVQLNPDQVPELSVADELADTEASDFGIDTEFKDIFSDGAQAAAGQGESVDFELDGAADAKEDDGGEMADTHIMLPDLDPRPPPSAGDDDESSTLVLGRGLSGEVDEIQTKLDLAQAYIDMEDFEGARGILGEVLAEGNLEQQETAKGLLTKLA